MRPLLWITALALLGLAVGAQAGQHQDNSAHRYRWVDATGLPHYSDSLSVNAVQYGYEVLDANGRVIRHVPRVPTQAEINAAQAKSAHRQTVAEQRENDRQILMAYPTEADFKAAQQARVDKLTQRIHTTQLNLDSQEQNLAQLLAHAADFSRQGEPVPHALGERIATQRQTVAAQRKRLKEQTAQRAATREQVATNLVHYRQLRARQQARYGQ